MSETKVISTRVTAAEFARLGALAEAQGITIAELARAILGSNGSFQTAEIVAAIEQLIDRIQPGESPGNPAEFEALNVRLSGIERALSAALDVLEQGGVPPSGVRAEGVGFAVEALQGLHGGRDQEVIGELR